MNFNMTEIENFITFDWVNLNAITPEMLIITAVVLLVLIALVLISELFQYKRAFNKTLEELSKHSRIVSQQKSEIAKLKSAMDSAVNGKYRHPEKGYFISKEEFYHCVGIKL